MATQPTNFLDKDFTHLKESKIILLSTLWNKDINDALVSGAEEVLAAYPQIQITKKEVPGCVEIGYALQKLTQKEATSKNTVIIAFGCVIRGGTPHFDYVCENVNNSVAHLNMQQNIPIIFGVLTLENEEQAWERLGGIHGHKGKEAAQTALCMLEFNQNL